VTVPHKVAALGVADTRTPTAEAIGAANTLSFEDGIEADNTDAPGFLAALDEPVHGRTALVLGAGGAARAVVWALVDAGAEVAIWNRTPERAQQLADDFGAVPKLQSAEIVVNATSVGLHEGSLPLDGLDTPATAVELVYGSDTPFTAWAQARGARIVDGLEILVRQGALSFARWTGIEPPLETMRRAAKGEILL
jgi:shikimate dehydrogenase